MKSQAAKGADIAYGRNVGPPLVVERPDGMRIYDHTLLDRSNVLTNPVEVKSGQGRIPKKQLLFDQTMDPPVVYHKEKELLPDAYRMLGEYDRLWILRNPRQ